MLMRGTINVIALILIFHMQFLQYSYSQTYISDSLRIVEENHIRSKRDQFEKIDIQTNLQKAVIIPFDESVLSEKSYFMISFDAVSTSGSQTKASIDDYYQQVKSKLQNLELIIDFAKSQIHFVDTKTREFNSSPFTINNESGPKYILISGCSDCSESKFNIVNMSEKELIIDLPSQDENQFFSTRIYLQTKI